MADSRSLGGVDAGGCPRTVLSVVVTTHDRPTGVRRALASVLDQVSDDAVDVVVVDDGSGPTVAEELDGLSSPKVRVVHQPDRGLGVARRLGAEVARGAWITFLDDDDRWRPNWMDVMTTAMTEDVGVVCAGTHFVDEDGHELGREMPRALGPAFDGVTGQYLAGCFVVRREVYERAGGYLPGLPCSHQTELFLRMVRVVAEMSLRVEHRDVMVTDVERRRATGRSLSNPRLLFDGARWLVARHRDLLESDPEFLADNYGVIAVNGARLGRWGEARRAAVAAARLNPRSARSWARVAGTAVPAAGRRVWGGSVGFRSPSAPLRDPLGHVADLASTLHPDSAPPTDLLFLPWRYEQNEQRSHDRDDRYWSGGMTDGDDRNQAPVYRLAARMSRRRDRPTVVDVGCGTGTKLVRYVAPDAGEVVGIDQPSGIALARSNHPQHRWVDVDLADPSAWSALEGIGADIVICADVIEHVDDPYRLLAGLRSLVRPDGIVVVSTPDRDRLERSSRLGPPSNPRHVREWSADELELLVEAAGFRVVRRRHVLPRRYSATRTDLNRVVYRGVHRMAVPDRRTGLVLELGVDHRNGDG